MIGEFGDRTIGDIHNLGIEPSIFVYMIEFILNIVFV